MSVVGVRGRRIPSTAVRGWMEPMLATLVDRVEDGRGWLFERKLDGFRALAYRDGSGVRLYSRNKLPLGESFPTVVSSLERVPTQDFVIDGEVVAVVGGDAAGFEALQQRTARTPIRYYVFDVLRLGGADVRELPYVERRRLLQTIRLGGTLKRTAARRGDPELLRAQACEAGWEGLISKRAESPYRAGRTRDWLKLKCVLEQEFVVGGFTDPKGSRAGFGALLIGYYEDGELRFAGEVGTGFDERTLRDLSRKMKPLETDRSPFADHPRARKGQHFVKPTLVAEVRFTEWTRDGKLRHPTFLGVRPDKDPRDVARERPQR